MATKSAPLRRVQVSCLMPLWLRFSLIYPDRVTGEAVEVEVVWSSRGRWQRWCAGHDTSEFQQLPVGPFTLAIALR